ncbi:MAG: AraC family transcriptional regulator [Lachnospiraceae bacterium]|nr:AraC family transcriptional regulator [Lachnospiraceae bacterium]
MARTKRRVIEYRDYNLPADMPIILLSGDNWHISDISSDTLHFHNCLEIGYCHTDSGFIEYADQKQAFKAGDVTIISRNVPHTTYSSKGQSSLWSYLFLIPEDLLFYYVGNSFPHATSFREMLDNICIIIHPEDNPDIPMFVKEIMKEMSEKRSNWQFIVCGLIMSLMMRLLRIYRDERTLTSEKDDYEGVISRRALVISPALSYIRTNYMYDFSINELAEMCHLSQTHFRRTFHEIMQTSPLDFLNTYRIEQACIKLRLTNEPILNISEQVGFQSVSSFNRHFLHMMNLKPSDYRKQYTSEKSTIHKYLGWISAEVPKNTK